MSKLLYFLSTFADSGLSVFGVRTPYDQPKYQVLAAIAPAVEIRAYAPRTVVETDLTGGDSGQAFGRLFRYITGANTPRRTVAMTVPVETDQVMRFYLPPAVVAAGAPIPTEAGVRIATIAAQTLAVIRYSGTATDETRAAQADRLRDALVKAGKTFTGTPLYFSYDPPFAIPFLRRNEVALEVK